MRYHEIIEAARHDRDPEHDRQQRAVADQRKAQQALAETDADQPDYHTEHQLWLRYWAKQKRLNRALMADAEKRSRGLSNNVSMHVSALL